MALRLNSCLRHTVHVIRQESRIPVLAVLLAAALPSALLPQRPTFAAAARRAAKEGRAIHTAEAQKGYVGSEACASCHTDIYNHYLQTSMGRSMSYITPELLETLHLPATYYSQRLNRHFEVYAQDGKLYQSEFATDAGGKDVFRDTHWLQWIIGAGENGFGVILQQHDYLFQAPLSFYSKPMTWEPSPGYELADISFNRPILAGCLFCHSGRSRPVSTTNGRFDNIPFFETAIGCENCHGPGAAHVQAMRSATNREAPDLFIVNPAHLTPYISDNICMSCHQAGDVRILKPGKDYQDFRPGTPLGDTLSILMVPPTRESPPDEDHTQHYYSMTLSKCYRASAGRLRCITCHDPHFEPSRLEAPAYFNRKCLTCHTNQSCTLSPEMRQQSNLPDNCIGCHMPKRDVQTISHSSITNHRILARPGEPFPDMTFQQATPALPDLVDLDPAPGKKDAPPPLLTLLQAYGELAAYKPEYVAPYMKVLNQLSLTDPGNALVQAGLGSRDLKDGKLREAANHFQRALRIGPPQAIYYAELSAALEKLGRNQEALSLQQKAVAQDPYNPLLQRTLVQLYIHMRQYSNAQTAFAHYLEIFPQDSYMRQVFALAMKQASPQSSTQTIGK